MKTSQTFQMRIFRKAFLQLDVWDAVYAIAESIAIAGICVKLTVN